jgi:hypothetical protein
VSRRCIASCNCCTGVGAFGDRIRPFRRVNFALICEAGRNVPERFADKFRQIIGILIR